MINFYAPINMLGYGVHSYNFIKALSTMGVEVALFPINNNVEIKDAEVERWLSRQKKYRAKDVGVMIFHEWEMNKFYNKIRIGFPVFETTVLEEHLPILASLDYILQPSMWGVDKVESFGFKNVHFVPEGYDDARFNMNDFDVNTKMKILDEYGVIFSHVGKLEDRKSSLDILKTFTYALDGEEKKCRLIAHMYNQFLPDWESRIREELLGIGYVITLHDETATRYQRNNLTIVVVRRRLNDVREVYKQSHFGIYASKAEGWNLPLIESIACGVPCITTNWTGQSQYLLSYPSELLIAKGEEVVANDGIWFRGNRGSWTTPDLSSLKQILRSIVKDPAKYLRLNTQCYESIKNYTWTNSAKTFLHVMSSQGIMY